MGKYIERKKQEPSVKERAVMSSVLDVFKLNLFSRPLLSDKVVNFV
jgi:hypothetical protein